jgi:hypothetical protein
MEVFMQRYSIHPFYLLLSVLAAILLFYLPLFAHADQFKSTGMVDVYFSPDCGTTAATVNEQQTPG